MGIRQGKRINAVPFWRSRLAAIAMLSTVSAVAITGLAARTQAFTVLDGTDRYVVSTLSGDPAQAVQIAGVAMGEYDAIVRAGKYNELTIDRAFVVNVTVDGITKKLHMTGGTVEDALQKLGVDTAGYRLVDLQMTDNVGDGLDICLESVLSYNERTETETIPFKTQVEYTTDLPKGKVEIIKRGENGSITRKLRDTLENGEAVSTTLLSETRVEPVTQIQRVGTRIGVPMSPAPYAIELDKAGQPMNHKGMITDTCTAYTSDRGLCGTVTSTGRPASVGVVAVDPKVIPYGTELYIVSADGSYVYGYAIAGDTGGACRAGRIVCDLYMDTYEECVIFGRRPMNVYILN